MDKMQSLFCLLVPKHPTQRYFGYRRQKPARQAGERRVMSQDWRVTGPLPLFKSYLFVSICIMEKYSTPAGEVFERAVKLNERVERTYKA